MGNLGAQNLPIQCFMILLRTRRFIKGLLGLLKKQGRNKYMPVMIFYATTLNAKNLRPHSGPDLSKILFVIVAMILKTMLPLKQKFS